MAVSIIFDAKQKFKKIKSCSFDKGFHSPTNQKELGEILDTVVLPFKGKLSEKRKAIEYSEEFLDARKKHSAERIKTTKEKMLPLKISER